MNFSAVILAGGKSSRMGRDKAFLEFGGKSLLARQIETAVSAGATEVFISGRADTGYSEFGLRVVQDVFPDAGPLAGIHAALAVARHPLLLALAVDLPNLRPDLLREIFALTTDDRGAIPRWENFIEPLAAFYPKSALPRCIDSLRVGSNSVRDFAGRCVEDGRAGFFDLPAASGYLFLNLNSPADAVEPMASSSPGLPRGGAAQLD